VPDAGTPTVGAENVLGFCVRREGGDVEKPGPYLGALGNLVALPEGDLAYLHVHPTGGTGSGIGFAPRSRAWAATVCSCSSPTSGRSVLQPLP
jgi:hypothetical protein